MLGEEFYLPFLDPQHALREIYTRLVCFQHVQAKR